MSDHPDRIPPQDLDAEQACLGSMLLGGDAARRLVADHGLTPEDFYRDAHKSIAAACFTLADESEPIDLVAVARALRAHDQLEAIGGFDYLDRLTRATPYSTNAGSYATMVIDLSRKRQLLEGGRRVASAAYDPTTTAADVREILDEEATTADRASRGRSVRPVSGRTILERARLQALAMSNPIPTGFDGLDKCLRGGFRRHQVHLLTARTTNGKSNLVLSMLRAAVASGRRVGLASLEMQEWEVWSKWISQETGIQWSRVVDSLVDEDAIPRDQRVEFRDARERFDAGNLLLWFGNGAAVGDLHRSLRWMRHEGCELVAVDLINRVSVPGVGHGEIYARMTAADAMLQDAGPDLGIPLIVVAQQHRLKGEKASLEGVKGSGAMEENSPIVMILALEEDEDTGEVTGKLEVAKTRDGVRAVGKRAIRLVG
ncbi:MAG TPA: DnaB-like helicase N-terminal domain-containing protein, partial [Phycisphaerae bacterium]|nr:DnaB-like helicase N-terminal domain-containing protein [Phycisphaerae bacterium]